ncbi:septum site-determining protein MinC [Lapidilactobacillus dextrinicus]|uniref:septum site-determining protein MinC n=1 Tax=Lapidilactobacillus dextrinicus TaxID=51664 RepID=UPI0022E3A2A4|nr:septum site-determining protein MinC [Lapidilactobacillus dextrinicus]
MENISLKASNTGYQIEIPATSDFEQSLTELKTMLQKVRGADKSTHDTEFSVKTGQRLLTSEQQVELEKVITAFDHFSMGTVTADVQTNEAAAAALHDQKVYFVPQIIRSGQEVFFDGDVVLLGKVHQGAILEAAKNIYVVGNVDGAVLHAGYPDNNDAIITGDVRRAAQIRISNLVAIVADSPELGQQKFAYVNDQHELAYAAMTDLEKQKPELYRQMEAQ